MVGDGVPKFRAALMLRRVGLAILFFIRIYHPLLVWREMVGAHVCDIVGFGDAVFLWSVVVGNIFSFYPVAHKRELCG